MSHEVRVHRFKKVFSFKAVLDSPMVQCPSSLVPTFIFPAALFWSPTAASKLGAVKSTLLNKNCANQKNPRGFVIPLIKAA